MRDLSDTVEMATLDKEMAEERVSVRNPPHQQTDPVSLSACRVRACRRRWMHIKKR
jgi:hypothetical protein